MNHLCGLEVEDPLSALNSHEREVLATFRGKYESELILGNNDLHGDDNANDKENDDWEEKKDLSTRSSSANKDEKSMIPKYEISCDDLSESGWRPLDDVTLHRYLQADQHKDGTFDIDASYHRLLGALQFRKDSKSGVIVKNIASSTIPPTVKKCQRLRVGIWAGCDHSHRPVIFERLGQFFSSGNGKKVSEEDWIESYLYFLETHYAKMRESAKVTGKPINRIVYFADFQGVVSSILNRKIWIVVPLLKRLVQTVECHYPEIVDHITLFNVPRIASAVYNVVKGFLDPVTAEKIELHPGVPLDRFREIMSDDVIPLEYGGSNEMSYPQTASK